MNNISQVATTGPAISQRIIILIIAIILIVAALVPARKANKPDLPLPICEINQDCEVYEIEP